MLADKVDSKFYAQLKEDMTNFLFDMVKIRSYSNEEVAVAERICSEFEKIPGVKVNRLEIDNSLKENPLWCCGPKENNDYTGHFNVEVIWEGTKEQEPIYFNAHMDTVDIVKGNENMLDPYIENDILYGLGACDDKGGIATVYTTFRLLSHFNVKLPFDVIAHFVVEEEIGGNGALAVSMRDYKGQAAVVMEPTDQQVQPVHRAGLWLKMVCNGESVHTAAMHNTGLSGYELGLRAVSVIKKMHDAYKDECKAQPVKYYEDYTPMLNVGMFHSGDWPATVPAQAVVHCSVGVLPNLTTKQMRERIQNAVDGDELLKGKVICSYVFDRDSSVLDFDHPLVKEVVKCVKANGMLGEVKSMKCLSDKYFYQEILGIPTVNFGPGSIAHAHSGNEQVNLTDVMTCGNILHDFLLLRADKK